MSKKNAKETSQFLLLQVECVFCPNRLMQIIDVYILISIYALITYTYWRLYLCVCVHVCYLSTITSLFFRLIGYNLRRLYTSIGHIIQPNNWSLIRIANYLYISFCISFVNQSLEVKEEEEIKRTWHVHAHISFTLVYYAYKTDENVQCHFPKRIYIYIYIYIVRSWE